jgi:hypothetical protein
MLVLVAVDIYSTKCMLVLRFIDPSLDQDLSVIIDYINQLPSWEALHVFLSVLPDWDDLHAHCVKQKYSTCMCIIIVRN